MSEIIPLDKNKFAVFMELLNAVSKACDDLVINEGKVCQKSNNRKFIYQIDLTTLLGTPSLMISGVAAKQKTLGPFHKQQVDMEIVIDDFVTFQDQQSQFKVIRPLASHIANPFMTNESVMELLNIDTQGKIAEFTLEKHLIDRLIASSDAMAATLLRLQFGNNIQLKIRPSDISSTTVMNLVTIDDIDLTLEGYANFAIEPFQLNVDEFKCEVWYRQGRDHVLLKLEAFLDGEEQVPMILWGLSDIKTE